MSQTEFNKHAQESILFAVFKAEEYGITPAQVTLWLNAMRAHSNVPRIVSSDAAIAKHFGG